jgi:hypothetical protein
MLSRIIYSRGEPGGSALGGLKSDFGLMTTALVAEGLEEQ